MKNIKFSRLFAAFAFVAILALAGCKQPEEETPYAIEGTWYEATYGQKFEITHNELKNYGGDVLFYAGDNLVVEPISDEAGYIYIKYTENATYSDVIGGWYAVSYKSLTDTSAEIAGAYKATGVKCCDTLEEAKAEFTIDNGYYSWYDTFAKQ